MGDPSPEFRVSIVHAGGGTTLELGGDVDLANAPELTARLEAVIDASTGAITVDLSHVTFLDSSGVEVLVLAQRRLKADGRRLTVRNPSELVFRVLKLSGVAGILDVQGPAARSAD